MRKQFAKKNPKLAAGREGEKKPKYGQLAFVSVLCALAFLTCFYFLPLPDESSTAGYSTDATDDKVLIAPHSPTNLARNSVQLQLPTLSVYTSSEKEKSLLLNEVEKAVVAYPNDASILHIAGLTYSELQQTAKAIEFLKRAISADATNPQAIVALAEIFMQVGKQEDAATVLEKAINQGVSTELLLSTLGEAYSQLGRIEEAVKTLERAVAASSSLPEQSKAPLRLAQALTQLGRFEEAEKYARSSLTQRPSDVAAYVALSNVLMRQNKREEAVEIRKQMPKPEPNLVADDQKYELSFRGFASHNYAQLGSAYAAHNSALLAEQLYVRSLQLTPDSTTTALLLADLMRREGRTQDTITTYKRLVQIQPDNLMNYQNLASLAVSVNDLPLAENALRMATTKDKTGAADLLLAKFLLGTGKAGDLTSIAQNAVERLGTIDAYMVLIDALIAVGDRSSAHTAFLKAKAIAPNDPRLAKLNL